MDQRGRDVLLDPLLGDLEACGPHHEQNRGRGLQMRLRSHGRTAAVALGLASLVASGLAARRLYV